MHPTDYKEWSDNKLVEEYLINQQMVFFDELYKRYSNKVYYKCYSLLGDFTSAEDATQDIFLKNIERVHQISKTKRPLNYILLT